MPRQPRYFLPGIPQHVIQRGVDRQAVFFHKRDYDLYRSSLYHAANRYGCAVHAYVLMTNHVHLLLTPKSKDSLPLSIQAMGRTYVQAINKIYNRTGTLWEGRYKASLIQDDHRLLTCQRYIELNPVRAGMVATPRDYPYSSHLYNALGKPDELLAPHTNYLALGNDRESRLSAYRSLFENPISAPTLADIRTKTNACLVIGNDRFRDQIEIMLGRSVRHKKSGRPRKPNK